MFERVLKKHLDITLLKPLGDSFHKDTHNYITNCAIINSKY